MDTVMAGFNTTVRQIPKCFSDRNVSAKKQQLPMSRQGCVESCPGLAPKIPGKLLQMFVLYSR